jgi:hypothetical protein
MIQDLRIVDVSSRGMRIPIMELQITKKKDGNEKAKNRRHMFRLETEYPHGGAQVRHADGIIAERAGGEAVGT